MAKPENTIALSELQQNASGALKRMRRSNRPLVVTQRGKATAVLLSVRAYQKNEHERELLKLLAKGEMEIAAGKGYELEQLLAEADNFLSKI